MGAEEHQNYLWTYLRDHFGPGSLADVVVVCRNGKTSLNRIYLPLVLPELPLGDADQSLILLLPDLELEDLLDRRRWLTAPSRHEDQEAVEEEETDTYRAEFSAVVQMSCDEAEEKDCRENANLSDDIHREVIEVLEMKCSVCGKVFKSRGSFNTHLNIHNKQFKCRFCKEIYARKDYLQRHEYNEHREQVEDILDSDFTEGKKLSSLVKCTFCPSVFRAKSQLEVHERKHTGEKPYQCSECPVRCTTVWNLRAHLKKHSGGGTFSCEKCGKFLSTNTALKDHMTIHTGERPHKCTQCGVSFKRSTNLWRHRKRYHNVTKNQTAINLLDISVIHRENFDINSLKVDSFEVIVDNEPYSN